MLDVFFSPGRLGDSLAARPRWLWAMTLCVVLGTATGSALLFLPQGKKIFMEEMRKKLPPAKTSDKGDEADPVKKMWPMFVGIGMAGAVLGPPIVILLCAVVQWVVCTAILGSAIGFRHHVAAASHGYLILAVGGLLSTFLVLVQGHAQLTLSLAAFVSEAETSLSYRVLSVFDFFRLWWIGATAVIAARAGRVSAMTVVGVLLALYLLLAGTAVAIHSFLPQGTLS